MSEEKKSFDEEAQRIEMGFTEALHNRNIEAMEKCYQSNPDILDEWIDPEDPDKKIDALMFAAKNGLEKCVRWILDKPLTDIQNIISNQDNGGKIALWYASIAGHSEITDQILYTQVAVNASKRCVELVESLDNDSPPSEDEVCKEVSRLLYTEDCGGGRKADVNFELIDGSENFSPMLHHAALMGYLKLFELLMAHEEIDIDRVDYDGDTPLHNAVIGRCLPIIDRLHRRSCKTDVISDRKLTAIQWAMQCYNDEKKQGPGSNEPDNIKKILAAAVGCEGKKNKNVLEQYAVVTQKLYDCELENITGQVATLEQMSRQGGYNPKDPNRPDYRIRMAQDLIYDRIFPFTCTIFSHTTTSQEEMSKKFKAGANKLKAGLERAIVVKNEQPEEPPENHSSQTLDGRNRPTDGQPPPKAPRIK